ncbi:class I SAM-dependent methyltransferase [Ferroacidibacillus organovorans]|uniref:class I SAM-dependent methyltransferase n=1 Tax=Ferroacidibacillus organovorans TaxID=1765683 RepID=UPI000AE967B9|nr:methyltransferase domain-containing protein [Ferroacidibacillus organovorans]
MQFNLSSKERVQKQFGQNAEKYVSSEGHAHGTDLALAIEWLQPALDDVMLDIATGGGHVAKALAPSVKSVMVSDLTPAMLETARKHLTDSGVDNAHYVLADAEHLPFLDHSFDVVSCRIAPHHFPDPDAFIREVGRVLRPNGRFLLIDNVAPDDSALSDFVNLVEGIRDPSHVKCLTAVQWQSLLEKNGLLLARDLSRKKKFRFQSWLDRMAPTEAHRLAVSTILLHAPQDFKTYFQIEIEDGTVSSFETDEWIALAVKV